MSVRFEHKLLQADPPVSISFILETSPHYNYYDTVSDRFEHTLRRKTRNLSILLDNIVTQKLL